MPRFRPALIVPLALAASAAASLAACSSQPDAPPPLDSKALGAVTKDAGAPTEDLARAVDTLFTDPELGETRAVLVMQGGKIAAERYAPGYDKDTRMISWSMAKTVTGVMIGMLVADGQLRLDQSPPIPRWQRPGDPRGEITLRQLLQMRSGLRHTEAGPVPYESSEVRMLFLDGRDNMAAYAESQPLEAEPGAKFEYSSNTTVILADIAARVLTGNSDDPETRRQAVAGFLRDRLFGPLGMTSMVPEFDAHGTLIGGSLIHGTARDWATFGEFLRHGGSWKGAQLVPRQWVTFMTSPSPREKNYGAQTWLNTTASQEDDPLHPISQPSGIFAAIGHMGQYIIVSPKQRLTVVRLGHSDEAERRVLLNRINDVVDLYPAR
ncbi:serine hydrolase [Erythrobacter sp. 3-20A1M]|uniref:serine hydrolase domain-containing protein n=1 Tax=Erythrobacter sp. 3-20A1M TaxID=2653850 RepID=UPI001BFC07D0|nr:serine hydrolase [Erythrobacter sp. 3-20A1M]QWC56844.1 serine hydrolase [Erythrobacter sp. 3-20A1M]